MCCCCCCISHYLFIRKKLTDSNTPNGGIIGARCVHHTTWFDGHPSLFFLLLLSRMCFIFWEVDAPKHSTESCFVFFSKDRCPPYYQWSLGKERREKRSSQVPVVVFFFLFQKWAGYVSHTHTHTPEYIDDFQSFRAKIDRPQSSWKRPPPIYANERAWPQLHGKYPHSPNCAVFSLVLNDRFDHLPPAHILNIDYAMRFSAERTCQRQTFSSFLHLISAVLFVASVCQLH